MYVVVIDVVIDVGGDDSEALESKPLGVEGARELLDRYKINFRFGTPIRHNLKDTESDSWLSRHSCMRSGSNLFFSFLSLST
jgi:hypothetical protein